MIYFEHKPFAGLELRDKDLQGWGPGADAYQKWTKHAHAKVIVEVGVWKGSSTIHLANWLKFRQNGVLFAVDTWLGALEFWNRRVSHGAYDATRDLKWINGYPSVYLTFMSNIVHAELQDYVVPFPVSSRLAAEFFAEKALQADFIHIDAAHEYEDVREDIKLWWPLVRPCGILMGDDYTDAWPGVMRAANEFAGNHSLKLFVEQSIKWVVQKNGPHNMPCGQTYPE